MKVKNIISFTIALCVFLGTSISSQAANYIVDALKIYQSAPFSKEVENTMYKLSEAHPNTTELKTLGTSVDGNPLPAIKIGRGKQEILILGGMHARECMTSVLVLSQLEAILLSYENKEFYNGYDTRQLLDNISIWFFPLLNPDGAEIAMNGPTYITNKNLLYSIVTPDFNFKKWKSNLNGVDLNSNYDLSVPKPNKWPSFDSYGGAVAYSEPETQALMNFCNERDFQGIISYHAAGEIIYWDNPYRDIAERFSRETGYSLVPLKIDYDTPARSFRDWFASHHHSLSFTIEIGKGAIFAPLSSNCYTQVWKQNQNLPLILADEVLKRRINPSSNVRVVNHRGYDYNAIAVAGRICVPFWEFCENLNLDGWQLLNDVPFYIYNQKEYVDVDLIIQKYGVESIWDGYTNKLLVYTNPITVYYNGNKIELPQRPLIEGDITLVPFRQTMESMGAEVKWNDNSKTVTATKNDIELKFTIGSNEFFVNNEMKNFDIPAKIVNNSTMISIHVISESFKEQVTYDSQERIIDIFDIAKN